MSGQHGRGPEGAVRVRKLGLLALGVVFGDIGTSPLYALRECFHGAHGIELSPERVLGVLSLVFWAITSIITLKYMSYVMRADNEGEGGVLALMALATTSAPRRAGPIMILGLIGASLLYGDGMITPAISVLSAVEGLEIAAPALHAFVIPVTICILIGLFSLQKRGTAGVGLLFGPVTLVWFVTLAVLGVAQLVKAPEVLAALSPHHGIRFLIDDGWDGFVVLGSVVLVVTGGEALYADMGHFGVKPLRLDWFGVVMPALLLNYFGQGALLLRHPEAVSNPFYLMAPTWALYPLIGLSTLATVIASQALISGTFSITRQASMLGYWPRVRIEHTSADAIGQIYVPSVNWALMIATITLVLGFKSSSALAAAYGIAVTCTMVITTALAYVVARDRWRWSVVWCVLLTLALFTIEFLLLGANVLKIKDGGWFPLVVAVVIVLLMTTWRRGRIRLGERIMSQVVPLDDFLELLHVERFVRVPGTAVYMVSSPEGTPPALMQNAYHHRAVHENVVLLTVQIGEVPRIDERERVAVELLPDGFVRLIARYGFMESPNIPVILSRDDTPTPPLEYTTFFLGRETVLAENSQGMARWRKVLFAFMSRNSQRATAFFAVPADRVIEVGSLIEL